jgi:hypothetical protein
VYLGCELKRDLGHCKRGQRFDMIAVDFKTFVVELYERKSTEEELILHSMPFSITLQCKDTNDK